MTRILLYIKHKLPFIWILVVWLNALLFRMLHIKKVRASVQSVITEYALPPYTFRPIVPDDLKLVKELTDKQAPGRLDYFNPHKFDLKSLEKAYANPSFIMMGAFDGSSIIGYFFLRCFWNRKCFVGRLIDEPYEGKGIGRTMNDIMYNIAWQSGFRCFSTISKNNQQIMRSHAKNKSMKVLKELKDDYLLVEFIHNS